MAGIDFEKSKLFGAGQGNNNGSALGDGRFEFVDIARAIGLVGGNFVAGGANMVEGITDAVSGTIANIFGNEETAKRIYKNSWSDDIKSGLTGGINIEGALWNTVGEVSHGAGSMTSRIAIAVGIAALTGGLGAGAAGGVLATGAGKATIGSLVKAGLMSKASYGLLLTSAYGGGMAQAVNTTGQIGVKEHLYGIGSAALELGTEKMFGFANGISNGLVDNVSKSIIKNATVRGLIGEGIEEMVSEMVNPLLQRATIDKNAKNATVGEILKAGFMGAAVAGVVGGASNVSNKYNATRVGNKIINSENGKERVNDIVSQGEAYNLPLANSLRALEKDRGRKPTASQVGRLVQDINAKTMEASVAKVAKKYGVNEEKAKKRYVNELALEVLNNEADGKLFASDDVSASAVKAYTEKGGELTNLDMANTISNYGTKNVKYVYEEGQSNAWIENGTDITINLASKKLPTVNATHEVVHTMDKVTIREMFNNIAKTDELFAKKVIGEYKKHELTKNYSKEQLEEEVVARYFEKLITDPKTMIKEIEGNITLGDKVLVFFKGFKKLKDKLPKEERDRINGIYDGYVNALAQARATKEIASERPVLFTKTNKNMEAVRQYDLAEIVNENEEFGKQIEKIKNNSYEKSHLLVRVDTPKILIDVGLKNMPILITANHTKTAMGIFLSGKNIHSISRETMAMLPKLIETPAIVMDSAKAETNSVLMFINAMDNNGSPILCVIKASGKGVYNSIEIEANVVTSVYGKDTNPMSFIEKAVNDGRILFWNKKKSQDLFNTPKLQLPNAILNLDFDTIIRKSSEKVNSGEENKSKVQFSILEDKVGKFVFADNNILLNNPQGLKEHTLIKKALIENIGNVYEVIEYGDKIYIGKDLPSEYTQSEYTKNLFYNKKSLLVAKNVVSTNIGELIEIASNRMHKENAKARHNEDARNGWYKYETRFAIEKMSPDGKKDGANLYNASLIVRHDADGKLYLYDVMGIKKEPLPLTSTQLGQLLGQNKSASKDSNTIIRKTSEKVNSEKESNSNRQYSLTEDYAEQVESALKNQLGKNTDVLISKVTPQILLDCGLKNLPILITQKHLRNISTYEDGIHSEYHGITKEQIKMLPKLIESPVAVMDSISVKGGEKSIVVITSEIDNKNRPIIVAIKVDGRGRYAEAEIDSNFVKSFYGKDGFSSFFNKHINENSILFVSKEKSHKLFRELQVQFPQTLNNFDFNTIIRKTSEKVNSVDKNKSNVQYSVAKTYKEQVSEYLKTKRTNKDFLFVNHPTEQLVKLGKNENAVLVAPSVIDKAQEKHGLSNDIILKLDEMIKKPLMIMKSQTVENSLIFFSEELVDGENIIVAIDTQGYEGFRKINRVSSFYAKQPSLEFVKKNAKNILWIDIKKGQEWLHSRGLQLPNENTTNDLGYIIRKTSEKVNNREEDKSNVQYSILEDELGKFVIADNNILLNNPQGLKEHTLIKRALIENVGNFYEVIEYGDKIYIGKDLPNEYTQSEYTKYLLKNGKNKILTAKKIISTNIGELIEIAKNKLHKENVKARHNEDAKKGWYKYNTRFAIEKKSPDGKKDGANLYNASLIVRHDADGKMYLYDIMGIKKEPLSLTSTQLGQLLGQNESANKDSIPIIRKTSEKVNSEKENKSNSKYSLNENSLDEGSEVGYNKEKGVSENGEGDSVSSENQRRENSRLYSGRTQALLRKAGERAYRGRDSSEKRVREENNGRNRTFETRNVEIDLIKLEYLTTFELELKALVNSELKLEIQFFEGSARPKHIQLETKDDGYDGFFNNETRTIYVRSDSSTTIEEVLEEVEHENLHSKILQNVALYNDIKQYIFDNTSIKELSKGIEEYSKAYNELYVNNDHRIVEEFIVDVIIGRYPIKFENETEASELIEKLVKNGDTQPITQYSLADIEKYNEVAYNSYGWVLVNEVLTVGNKQTGEYGEYAEFNKKWSEAKNGKGQFPRTKSGEHIISAGNKLVYVSGSYQLPKISKVLELNYGDETNNDIVRNEIYEYERSEYGSDAELLEIAEDYIGQGIICAYTSKDRPSYQESKAEWRIQQGGKASNEANRNNPNGKPRGYNYGESDKDSGRDGKGSELNNKTTIQYSLSDIDRYSEKEYNNYGWVLVNDVLTTSLKSGEYSEYADFNEKLANATMRGYKYNKTLNKELMIPVGNKLVYVSGSYQLPKISKVLELNYGDETNNDIVRNKIYEYERSGYGFEYAVEAFKAYDGETFVNTFRPSNSPTYQESKAEWRRQQGGKASNEANRNYPNGKKREYNFEESNENSGRDGETPELNKKFTKQYSVVSSLWSKLSNAEQAQFYTRISQANNSRYWFNRLSNGDYIFDIENKIIISDGKTKPTINGIVEFSKFSNKISDARDYFYENINNGRTVWQCVEIINDLCEERVATLHTVTSIKSNSRSGKQGGYDTRDREHSKFRYDGEGSNFENSKTSKKSTKQYSVVGSTKKYTKKDARELFDDLAFESMEKHGVKLTGKGITIEEIVDLLNSTTLSKSEAAIKAAADLIVNRSIVSELEFSEEKLALSARASFIRDNIMKKYDLSEISEELEHRYSKNIAKGILLAWSNKSGKGIDTIADISEELIANGIDIGENTNSADIFNAVKDIYDDTRKQLLSLLKVSAREYLGKDENSKYVYLVRKHLVEGYKKGLYGEIRALRQQVKDNASIGNLKVDILTLKNKAVEFAKRKYGTSSSIGTPEFMEIVNRFSKIMPRGSIDNRRVLEFLRVASGLYTEDRLNLEYMPETRNKIDSLLAEIKMNMVLSKSQIHRLKKIGSGLIHLYSVYDAALINGKREAVLNISKEIVDEDKSLPNVKFPLMYAAFKEIIDPNAAFMMMTGYNESSKLMWLYNDIAKGDTEKDIIYAELMSEVDRYIKKDKYVNALEKNNIKFMNKEIPLKFAISLYLTSKREAAVDRLYNSGVSITINEKIGQVNKKRYNIAEGEMDVLYAAFSDEDKEFIKVLERAFLKAKENKVGTDVLRLGYSNVGAGFYFPIYSDKDALAKSLLSEKSFNDSLNSSVNNLSMNKALVENAKAPLEIPGIMTVVEMHMRQVSMYKALAIPLDNFNKVWNKNIGDARNPISVRSVISARHPWSGKYISDLMKNVQGIKEEQGFWQKGINKFRSLFAVSALGGNIKVFITQFASYPMAAAFIKPKYLSRAMTTNIAKKLIFEASPFLKIRAEGFQLAKAESVTEKIGKFGEFLMKPISKVDEFTVNKIFVAAALQTAEENNLELKSPENLKLATELCEIAVRRTQPMYNQSERTAMMRSPNEIVKSFPMFTSAPVKQLSVLVVNAGKFAYAKAAYKEGKISKEEYNIAKSELAMASASVVTSMVMYSAISLAILNILGRRDDEENFINAFFEMMGGAIAGMFPILRDAYNYFLSGYEVENFLYGTFNNFLMASKAVFELPTKMLEGEKISESDIKVLMNKVLRSSGQLTGLPIGNIKSQIDAIDKKYIKKAEEVKKTSKIIKTLGLDFDNAPLKFE